MSDRKHKMAQRAAKLTEGMSDDDLAAAVEVAERAVQRAQELLNRRTAKVKEMRRAEVDAMFNRGESRHEPSPELKDAIAKREAAKGFLASAGEHASMLRLAAEGRAQQRPITLENLENFLLMIELELADGQPDPMTAANKARQATNTAVAMAVARQQGKVANLNRWAGGHRAH